MAETAVVWLSDYSTLASFTTRLPAHKEEEALALEVVASVRNLEGAEDRETTRVTLGVSSVQANHPSCFVSNAFQHGLAAGDGSLQGIQLAAQFGDILNSDFPDPSTELSCADVPVCVGDELTFRTLASRECDSFSPEAEASQFAQCGEDADPSTGFLPKDVCPQCGYCRVEAGSDVISTSENLREQLIVGLADTVDSAASELSSGEAVVVADALVTLTAVPEAVTEQAWDSSSGTSIGNLRASV
jgi:hypothetical protein